METTAVYDSATQEFIIDTPTPLAQKYWITNGATHAKHVVVFAQLNVDGMCLCSWFPNCFRIVNDGKLWKLQKIIGNRNHGK